MKENVTDAAGEMNEQGEALALIVSDAKYASDNDTTYQGLEPEEHWDSVEEKIETMHELLDVISELVEDER